MNNEGFDLFERKDEEVKKAEKDKKETVKKVARVESKPDNKDNKTDKPEKQKKSCPPVESVKLALLSLILIVCTVTMFFAVRTYYLCSTGENQQIVFLDDVLGSNRQTDIVVEQPDADVVTTTAATTQAQHVTIVTQPNNANISSGSVYVQDGNKTGNSNAGSAKETTTAAQKSTTAAAAENNNASNGLVNINTASVDQLMTLSGIGEVKAKAIVSYRNENGGFGSVDELLNVSGIGEKTLEKIRPYITVG